MNQNKLLLYGAILVLVSFTASCVEQPLQESIVCNKNINTDHVSEYTRVQEQSGLIYCIAVYDGDTITIKTGEKVRLIGIDAPELSEPGGDIARNFLACLVLNKEVHLEKGDVDTDSYNRLLRYVYVNGVCVNEEMIKNGYAEARYIPEKNRELYIQLEIKAETRKLALWKCTVFQPRLPVKVQIRPRWD